MANENLRFQVATEADAPAILEFIQSFFRVEEPISKSVAASREDVEPIFKDSIHLAVKYPVSFVVLDGKNDVVGVRLSTVVDYDQKRRGQCQESEDTGAFTKNTWKIGKFLDRLEEGMYEMVPLAECQKGLKFLILCVRPDYYRRGIAQKLIKLSEEAGKQLGCSYVTLTATAFKSQQLFKKRGYETLKMVSHSNYVDENGHPILNCDDGTQDGKLMVLKL